MAHPRETRKAVRNAYVYQRLALEAAAASLGVNVSTAQRWKREAADSGDNWDDARDAVVFSDEDLTRRMRESLERYLRNVNKVMDALDANQNLGIVVQADLITKVGYWNERALSGYKRLLPEIAELAVAMEVLQRLASFISEKYPQHAGAFLELLEPFGGELSRVYG